MRRPAARVAVLCALGLVGTVGATACTTAGSMTSGASSAVTGSGDDATSVGTVQEPTSATSGAVEPLVVETVFEHTTLDPTRQFERSGALVSRSVYQTLTTFDGADQQTPVAGLAEFTMAPEGKWLTLRLKKGVRFSDGTPITTDDVIFTLDRAMGLGGPTAAILGTVNAKKVDDRTLTLTSPGSNFSLPAVLANPSLGILNSAAVKAHGGTIGPLDTARPWLDRTSAGSGPYVIAGVEPGAIRLARNPYWTGPAVAFPEVLVRNAAPAKQLADLQSGAADVALDLSPAQASAAEAKRSTPPVTVQSERSFSTAFLLLNRDPRVNAWTANPDFVEAVRLGVDRAALGLAAGDALPARGLIPAGLVGALPAVVNPAPPPSTGPTPSTTASGPGGSGTARPAATPTGTPAPTLGGIPTPPLTQAPAAGPDPAAARAALARSGYRGQPIPLAFARDLPIQGIPPATIASALQRQLAAVGIRVILAPAPAASALVTYRAGGDAMGLWGWSPDFPDPENQLAFAPGGLVAQRARWPRGIDPDLDALTAAAQEAYGADRAAAYRAWQDAMNESSPFVPLIQPMTHYAHGSRVSQLAVNPVWALDIAAVR
ncbi:hypothetical protein N865_08415 [Intrasporangium oryzae NRRL B-24470]|uniref:Solute-binding protein family 5 domain-containing protein n=1 Tax=Intrasporangium oryzae NRRL B-24470 TaxID=1386089 RepID=W9GBU5_9MICO|nr:ABC transporter substrate-binding protein [Intrasporangium oryzae]EWT01339.1 hypothetical protein N865_08415 [Intrasporangium oryzae NRRL B-24470]